MCAVEEQRLRPITRERKPDYECAIAIADPTVIKHAARRRRRAVNDSIPIRIRENAHLTQVTTESLAQSITDYVQAESARRGGEFRSTILGSKRRSVDAHDCASAARESTRGRPLLRTRGLQRTRWQHLRRRHFHAQRQHRPD